MVEQSNELKSVAAVATNLELPSKLRVDALEALGRIGTHEALLAIKQAREIIKSGH